MNVAVGLARLGHDVTLLTRLGDDPYGELVSDHVTSSGVALAPGSVVAGARTSSALARLDDTGAATYEFDVTWELAATDLPPGLDCLHVGSIGTVLTPGAAQVRRLAAAARAAGVVVSYDPNVRTSFVTDRAAYRTEVEEWAAGADVVKASSDDVDFLTGETVGEAEVRWAAPFVVVTHGGEGISVATRRSWQVLPAVPVEVEDTIGAGDSFMSGLLDGLARHSVLAHEALRRVSEEVVEDVVRSAAHAAAITCGRAGADPPTRAELDAAQQALGSDAPRG